MSPTNPTNQDDKEDDQEEDSPISELPSSKKGSRLAINMAHILGRRRHTVCHIGVQLKKSPSTSPTTLKVRWYMMVYLFY